MSLRNIRKRRLRSWLTMIGIFIGIAAVVSLISLGEGLQNAVISQFSLAGADTLMVQAEGIMNGPPGSGAANPLTKKDLETIQRVKGVDFALGRIISSGSVEFNNQISYVYFGSFPEGPDGYKLYSLINLEAEQGRLLKQGDTNKVTLGHDFTDINKFGKATGIGSKIIIQGKNFEVVGILKKKGSFTVDSTILMNENQMRDLFEVETDTYSVIAVKVKSGVNVDTVKQDIEKAIRKERNEKEGEEDFSVETNQGALQSLESTLFAVQLFVYIIAGISIIVGGIGIMNTMYTAVLERTKEIGIMKAIGARNSKIFLLFFIESGLLGTVGGVIGVILGVIIAKGLAFIGQQAIGMGADLLNAHISPELLIGSILFSFIIGTVSGLFPAIQASKQNIVDAIRE